MKKIFTILLIVLSIGIQAQSIQAIVLDENESPLAYATVQLLKSDSTIQKIETTNTNGTFIINNLKEEIYYLSISFLGYTTFNKKVNLSNGNGALGKIILIPLAQQIGDVTISAEKPMIEVQSDKTVFNVSKSLGAAGDDGIELLRKAPGLQIDNSDNIIVEGKSGVNVYVNGKQTYLNGDDLTNYLKSIKSDEIEKIEIITQPSSKYDAAGSAGIINIVLKREKGLGTKGNISNTFSYGIYARNNTTLSLNHRSKKFSTSALLSYYQGASFSFFDMDRSQAGNFFEGETDTDYKSKNQRINLGGEYYLTSNSTLGLNVSGSLNKNESLLDSRTGISNNIDRVVDSILLAPGENQSDVYNLTTNLNYTFKDTNETSFSVDLDYVNFDRSANSYLPNIYVDPSQTMVLSENIDYQETPIRIEVYSIKSDYERKLFKGIFGTGVKLSQVTTDNVFDFFNQVNGDRTLDTTVSNTFVYDETIAAGYLNYKFTYKKVQVQLGLRAEQTISKGDLKSQQVNQNQVVSRYYINWFPSGGLTYKFNQNNSTSLIYSRRIERPSYQNLNPFEFQINELSFSRGNPFLQPQFIENIKLSNVYKYTLNTSFSFSYISDYFAAVTEAEGDRKSVLTTRNVADQQVYNLSISYPKKINDWMNVYASLYGYYTKFTANNPAFIPVDQTVFGGYAQATFSLPKKFKAEVSGWFSSPSIWRGTYKTKSMGALNVAFSKNWGDWTAKLSFNDILYTIPWRATTAFGNVFINGKGGSDSRIVRLFLSYSFGQKDVKEKKDRESGAEEEQNRIN